MQQTHEQQLDSLRKNLTIEIEKKPQKWSRNLIDCRRSLENVAKQASLERPPVSHTELYREAQQIKEVTDALHEKEENDMNSKFNSALCAKLRNLEKKQHAEMAALMKKIETKRREVGRKRVDDTERLKSRNCNIVKMLDTKNVSLSTLSPYVDDASLSSHSSTTTCARNWSVPKLPQIFNHALNVC